jgi:hypothetical protein
VNSPFIVTAVPLALGVKVTTPENVSVPGSPLTVEVKAPVAGLYGPFEVSWNSIWYMLIVESLNVTLNSEEIPSPQEVAGAVSVMLNVTGSVTPVTGAPTVAVPAARSRLCVAEISGVEEAVGVMVAVGGSDVLVAVAVGGGVVAVEVGFAIKSVNTQPIIRISRNDSEKPNKIAGFFIAINLPESQDAGSLQDNCL